MRTSALSQFGDAVVLHDFRTLARQELKSTAIALPYLAEVDARKLYRPEGFPSMLEFCVRDLGYSEDVAKRRIRAGRVAREFPAIFESVAAGRLHLSAVLLLKTHLNENNADDLVKAAELKSSAEVEQMLAERFPRTEEMPLVETLAISQPCEEGALAPPRSSMPQRVAPAMAPPGEVKPQAARRFAIHVTVDQTTHDLLRHAQDLLSHELPSGDIAEVLSRGLELLVQKLEKEKRAATDTPRAPRASKNARSIPAHVSRAVWKRDGHQCTFVADNGHRCASRRFLELDHIIPVARGGESTVANLRVLCHLC